MGAGAAPGLALLSRIAQRLSQDWEHLSIRPAGRTARSKKCWAIRWRGGFDSYWGWRKHAAAR